MEDHDSERLTEVVDSVAVRPADDDPTGMRVGKGTEVNGYVIDGELGRGGMGVVYSATHPVIGKRAAIKILRPDVSRSPVAVERFIQEARAVNQIGHPNIVDIFAYGALPDGRAYHVMDLLAGESLRKRLKRSVLHPSEAASVIDEIAQALTAAHDHGFVHRDLKPDNVFLVHREGRWPEVKLLDFGLAKLMPEYGASKFTTKAGVMLGTPEYMSPEQARGAGVDYRTDIYALGIVMFEILAGCRPFASLGDSLATLMQHAEEPPPSIADMVTGLPIEMVQLVNTMLAKTPEARPSLAAVRTVIKRLRTTQLPTRSMAGLELAALQQAASQSSPEVAMPANPLASLGITASRLGADPMLPGDPRPGTGQRPRTPSVPPPGSPLAQAMAAAAAVPQQPFGQNNGPLSGTLRGSAVGVAPVPVPHGGFARATSSPPMADPRPRTPSAPPPSSGPPSSAPYAPSPASAPFSSQAQPFPSQVQPFPSQAQDAPRARSPSYSGPPSSPGVPSSLISQSGLRSSSGMRESSQRLPVTTLGVGLTPKPAPSAAPEPTSRRWLIMLVALIVIAAGIAVAIAMV